VAFINLSSPFQHLYRLLGPEGWIRQSDSRAVWSNVVVALHLRRKCRVSRQGRQSSSILEHPLCKVHLYGPYLLFSNPVLSIPSFQDIYNSNMLLRIKLTFPINRDDPILTVGLVLPHHTFLKSRPCYQITCHFADDRKTTSSLFASSFIIQEDALNSSRAKTLLPSSRRKTPSPVATP